MSDNKASFVSISLVLLIYIIMNADQIAKVLDKSNADSPFAVIFSYGFIWSILTGISASFYFLVVAFMKKLSPKKIELATRRETLIPVTEIQSKDPNFQPDLFLKNVEKLAEKLNYAWTQNKMGMVRNLVSAGIHNRFNIQLKLMDMQGIQNLMQDWFLDSVTFAAVESDEVYQTTHVEIHAWARDVNVNKNLPESQKLELLQSTPQTDYYEIWSFVRKIGAITKKEGGLLSGNCPNCGASIEGLGELNQCKHCKSIINSGDYDWVLAEITQKIEWSAQSHGSDILKEAREKNPSVNRQVIEDRASYLFWRWIEARSLGKKEVLKRDASENFLKQFSSKKEFIENPAVGSVDLVNISENNGKFFVSVKILWSAAFQKDAEPLHRRNLFTLSLPINVERKGGLSSNSCESCGAPLPESDALNCEYCGAEVPTQVNDWILEGISKAN
jgi:hypothetical protein